MYVTDFTDDYDNMSLTNCTDNGNNIDIIKPTFLLTLPCGQSFLCLLSLMVYTSFNNKEKVEKFLYQTHPVRCIITGPGECGKSIFLTNLILKIMNEYDKTYIYSPSLHQDLYQKIIKCFSNYYQFT